MITESCKKRTRLWGRELELTDQLSQRKINITFGDRNQEEDMKNKGYN